MPFRVSHTNRDNVEIEIAAGLHSYEEAEAARKAWVRGERERIKIEEGYTGPRVLIVTISGHVTEEDEEAWAAAM